jgi:hypothetical protein
LPGHGSICGATHQDLDIRLAGESFPQDGDEIRVDLESEHRVAIHNAIGDRAAARANLENPQPQVGARGIENPVPVAQSILQDLLRLRLGRRRQVEFWRGYRSDPSCQFKDWSANANPTVTPPMISRLWASDASGSSTGSGGL